MVPLRQLKIKDKLISDYSDCFVIAEIGHNHQGDFETCKRLFETAKYCGVDAVKLQKRNNRALFTKKYFDSPYNSENAFGPTYGLHRQALEFNKKEYKKLKRYAEKLGLIFFATAFDFESADFLDELNVPCLKIASADITNIPFLKYAAKLKRPIILSTGTATIEDVKKAYSTIMPINTKLALLQCTAIYPLPPQSVDLRVIETYRKLFPDITIGFSNHFNGISIDPVAYTLGARIIEKHFTLDRSMKGSDHAWSLEPVGMRKLVRDLKRIRLALGDGIKKFYSEEEPARQKMGKCIVASRKLLVGHVITKKDLVIKSPCEGLLPYHIDNFYGKTLITSVAKEQPLNYDHILIESKSKQKTNGRAHYI